MTDPVMLLSQAHGEGRVTFRALRAAGFYSLAEIAGANVQILADRAHLSAGTARRLKSGAEEMMGRGIGDDPGGPDGGPDGGRGARSRPARSMARGPFSEGVSNDEAVLLGQGSEVRPIDPDPSPSSPQAPDAAAALRAIDMAAAAQAAASLSRSSGSAQPQPDPAPARPDPAPDRKPDTPSGRDRTFWRFG